MGNGFMRGQVKFDEFSIVILGGVIFLGIFALAFTTPTEFPPKIEPTQVKFSMDPGGSQSFEMNLTTRSTNMNVTTSGAIADWIQVPTRNYGVVTDIPFPITANIVVPDSARAGTYTGKVIVRSGGGTTSVDVTVVVSAVKKLSSRTMSIGDFDVLYSSGTDVLDSESGTSVSKSYLYEKPLNLVGIIENNKLPIITGGAVRFVVEDTNNFGPVVVTQNGREIFSEVVGPGEVVVPLNASDITRSTTITISAGGPGIFFWAENTYGLRDAELLVTFDGPVKKTFDFTLTPDEYGKFDHFQLTWLAKGSSSPLPPLKVELNDQTVYFKVPPSTVFNQAISRDIFNGLLVLGPEDTLVFSFDQEASYEVNDAKLTAFARA